VYDNMKNLNKEVPNPVLAYGILCR